MWKLLVATFSPLLFINLYYIAYMIKINSKYSIKCAGFENQNEASAFNYWHWKLGKAPEKDICTQKNCASLYLRVKFDELGVGPEKYFI